LLIAECCEYNHAHVLAVYRDDRRDYICGDYYAELRSLPLVVLRMQRESRMPVVENLRLGTRVQISGAAGVVVGRIEDIRGINELPPVPGFAEMKIVNAVLRDKGVTRLALVSYFMTEHQEVAFTAVEIAGEWFDLQGQAIQLEVIGQVRAN
jgi:hypothetical protein